MPDGSLQNIAAVLFPPMTHFKLVENEVTLICPVQLNNKNRHQKKGWGIQLLTGSTESAITVPCRVITQKFHKTDRIFSPRYLCSHHPTGPSVTEFSVRADKETAVSINWVNTSTGELPGTRADHEHCPSSPIQEQLAAFSLDAMSKVAPDSRAWKWKAKAILEGYTWMTWGKKQLLASRY